MTQIQCVSPVDGSVYATVSCTDDNDISKRLEQASNAQREWSSTSIEERGKLCSAAVDAMLEMGDEIVPELAWQMGRPVRFGKGELAGFEERARHMIDIAEESLRNIVPDEKEGFKRYIKRDPLGLVFTIAPWNYPYLTAVNSIIPALMAGNAVFLKHASQTILVGERFDKAFEKAGLPSGLFNNVVLTHDQTTRLIQAGSFNQIMFTGSVPAGKSMESAAAGTFTGLGLELGGKDPAYVRADADVEFSAENVVDGAFFNSGQSCCGIERAYVHESVYHAFLEKTVETVKGYILGNPLQEETTLGPMVKPGAADFVRQQIDAAVSAGAKTCIDVNGFELDQHGSAYMAPQVVVDVDHSMSLMTEESFGPVLGIMKVSSDEEAIALMNDSEFGLTASIWSSDMDAAEAIGCEIETGTVFLNRCDYLDPALTWTGVKNTGRGGTLSKLGYENLTRPKSFHLRA